MAAPLINGINYSWANVTVLLFGVPVIGITKIDYKSKQKKDNNYGLGVKPVSRGYGNYEFEGSLELHLDEWLRIVSGSPEKDPLSIAPFDIQVTYGGNRVTARRDVLKQVEFLENPLSASQGESLLKVTIPLIIGDIVRS